MEGAAFWHVICYPERCFGAITDQLEQIRKVQLSRVLCDNTDLIRTIQVYPLVLPDYDA